MDSKDDSNLGTIRRQLSDVEHARWRLLRERNDPCRVACVVLHFGLFWKVVAKLCESLACSAVHTARFVLVLNTDNSTVLNDVRLNSALRLERHVVAVVKQILPGRVLEQWTCDIDAIVNTNVSSIAEECVLEEEHIIFAKVHFHCSALFGVAVRTRITKKTDPTTLWRRE